MTGLALALVLVAAGLHAAWNLLAKRAADPFLFLWSAISVAALLFSPWAVLAWTRGELDRAALPYIAATGGVHAVYFVALGQSYRHGDLSRVYPIARGLGVALVPVIALVFLGERLNALGYAGVATVVAGIVWITRDPGKGLSLSPSASTAWALLTGLCVGAYSVIDKAGVAIVDPLPYVCLLNLLAAVLTAPFALARRRDLTGEWRRNGPRIGLAALMTLTAYLLVLHAFSAAKVGYVVAAREVSIVISALAGSIALGEGRVRQRVAGALVILSGVTLLCFAE